MAASSRTPDAGGVAKEVMVRGFWSATTAVRTLVLVAVFYVGVTVAGCPAVVTASTSMASVSLAGDQPQR